MLLQIMQKKNHIIHLKNLHINPYLFFEFCKLVSIFFKFYKLVSFFLYLKLIPMSKYFSKKFKNKKSDFLLLIQNKLKN